MIKSFLQFLYTSLTQRKLRFDIVTSFLTLFLIASALIVGYSYKGSRTASINFAQQLLKQITDTTVQRAGNYLGDAKAAAIFARAAVKATMPNFLEDQSLRENFMHILELYPGFTVVQVALYNGDYISVEKAHKGTKFVTEPDKLIPDDVVYLCQYQNRSSKEKQPLEIWTYYDKTGKVVAQEVNEFLVYDARKRPWFLNTEQKRAFNWSAVYMFSFLNVPGTTAGIPLFDRDSDHQKMIGVIGIDVSLAEISMFLQKNRPTHNSSIFIANEEGQLVASTNPADIVPIDTRNENVRYISDIENTSVKTAYDLYREKSDSKFGFEKEGKNYLAAILPLDNQSQREWYAGVVVPEDDFLFEAKKIKNHVLYLIIFSLLVFTFLIFLLSKRISSPIIAVAEETQRIQNLEINNEIKLKSSIYEIQLMLKSLTAMKNSLNSFIKFVPKTLIKKLLQKGSEVKLGGMKKELTIFFSDIANFTNISEGLSPEKLVNHLSTYFDELTKILTESNGTIDKYIGDSIMAFWGAPIHDRDQTFNACHAALKCQKRLAELNRQWELEGKPQFVTRIGLHRDEVLVGIIGSQEKMNYTIMGDGVNAASRLEGINKEYSTLILVSENVANQVGSDFLFRPLDIIAVKGKKKPMKIYELVAQYKGDASLLPSKEQKHLSEEFMKAFNLYTIQKFEQALAAFNEINTLYPLDYPTQLLIKRCQDFMKNPPPLNWDGVITYTHK